MTNHVGHRRDAVRSVGISGRRPPIPRLSTVSKVLGAVLLIGAGLTFAATPAGSTPTGQFEISDGDIADDVTVPAPDWGSVFGRTPAGGATAPVVVKDGADLLATSFVEDPLTVDALPAPPCDVGKTGDVTVFTSGGSDKNGDAIPTWTFESGSIPPHKDDLSNVYAAAKRDGSDTVFYFALERTDNNGSGHVDFEFLKSPVGTAVTGEDSSGCPSGNFTGSRTPGDVLLSLNFTNGGVVGTEDIRIWDGDSYEVPAVDPSDKMGLFQNSGTIDCGDWRCRKTGGGLVEELPQNAFTEGFINVTALGITGCFSSFNAKSRSSHEYNSELKDVALGEFNTCDANITITPDGINEVGDDHTFTAHVEANPDGTFGPAPDGTVVTFAKVSGPGTFTTDPPTCLTVAGSCSVTLRSTEPGTTVVSASTTVAVGPVTVTRSTNGYAGSGGSGNATKHWVDGYIKVTPTAVNPVNQQHVFTVELGVLPGGADTVAGIAVSASVTPTPGSVANDCASPTETAPGSNIFRCTVTINSATPGVFHVDATGSATVSDDDVPGSVVVTRSTDSATTHGPGGNAGADKTYVDARISVGPDGLNPVDAEHTVVGLVETKAGSGGWVPAPAGTLITFQKTGAGGFVGDVARCTTSATTPDSCSVAIVSSDSGATEVAASTTVVVEGVSITRTTGTPLNTFAGGSDNLVKRWVDASIRVVETAVNEVNDDHQFTVTVTAHRPTNETVTYTSITPSAVTAPAEMTSNNCDAPDVAADGLSATCTFTMNSTSAGIFDVDATAVVKFSGGGFEATVTRSTAVGGDPGPIGNTGATKTFVDARISVGLDGVNAVGDPHDVTGFAEFNDGTGWKPAAGRIITFATSGVGGFVAATSCTAGADGRCTVEIVSQDPGVQQVSASTSYPVAGVTLNRTTAVDGFDDPDNLRKEWVAATISITPTAVNEVGVPHVFDITVRAQSSGAPIVFGPVATTVTPAPASKVDSCTAPTAEGGTSTLRCTLTINNPTAGIFTANATTTVTIGGVAMQLATNGTGGSGSATKTYVDARISLSPSGVNAVGDPHPMTARLEVNHGTGWAGAPAGVTITVVKLDGPGSLSAPSCTTDAGGTCSVTLTSDTAGVSTVGASATMNVLGEPLTRSTSANAGPGGSGNVTKRWVDGAISISPTAVNPVGAVHTFEVTATAIPSGSGDPTFVITPSVTPTPDALSTTCGSPQVSGNVATCTVTINDDSPGVITANATSRITMGGVVITRSTDAAPSGPGGSGPATKTYVDANIQVGVDGVNAVGDPHTVTGHVDVNPGTGQANAADGTLVTFSIVSGPGSLSAPSCTTAGGTGSCAVTLNSGTAGVTVVRAASTVDVSGVRLDLVTNGVGANSGDLTKRWVDAFVTIGPSAVNPLNEEHVFTVSVAAIPSGATPVAFESITTAVKPAPGVQSSTCANPRVNGNVATCTLTINSSVEGVFVANVTALVRAGGAVVTRSTDTTVAPAGTGGSAPATKTYVATAVAGVTFERAEAAAAPTEVRGTTVARTGQDTWQLLRVALLLLGLGTIAVASVRRRPADVVQIGVRLHGHV